MSKIIASKVRCACCGAQVKIDRVFSLSTDCVGLSGNKHTSMQYIMEECPECHYVSLDIEDSSVRVSRGMLNAFRIKPGLENIKDDRFVSILKAADIYEKNKDYCGYSDCLRLASFYADEHQESTVSRRLLKEANEALQTYFQGIDELSVSDIMLAVNLIDGNRRLGMTATARNFCEEIGSLLEDAGTEELNNICRIIEFEKELLEKRDIAEHLISEVL